MSRTYAAIALSSSPESATILERALETCSPVGSGAGAVSRSHSPGRLAAHRAHQADQRRLRREALDHARAALDLAVAALLDVVGE